MAPKLYRVILQVDDLDRAEQFYGKLLGDAGRRIPRASRHYIDCGPVILALVTRFSPAAEINRKAVMSQSPGLPRFAATLGTKIICIAATPIGVVSSIWAIYVSEN